MLSLHEPSFVAERVVHRSQEPTANQTTLASSYLHQQPKVVSNSSCKLLTFEQLERADQTNRSKEWACAEQSRVIQLVRCCSLIFTKLIHIDVYGNRRADFLAGRPVLATSKPLGSLNERLRNFCSCPLVAQLIRLYFFYITIKLVLNNWWVHQYSSHIAASKRFERTLASTRVQSELLAGKNDSSMHLHRKQIEESLGQQLERERQLTNQTAAVLETLGSPYYVLGYTAETTFIYLLTVVWATYMQTQLVFHLRHPFDMGILRAIIDLRLEQSHETNAVICGQVNRFLISGANFVCAHQAELAYVHDFGQTGPTGGGAKTRSHTLEQQATGVTYLKKHGNYEQQAVQLMARQMAVGACLLRAALAGRLQPTNRNFLWLRQVAILYLWIGSITCIAGTIVLIVVLIAEPFFGFFSGDSGSRGPHETVFVIELLLFSLIGHMSIMFYLSSITVACLDQIRCVIDLTRDIKATIRRCELWLEEQMAQNKRREEQQSDLNQTETIARRQMQCQMDTIVQLTRVKSESLTLRGYRRLGFASRPSIILGLQREIGARELQTCNQNELLLNADVVLLLIRLKMFVNQLYGLQPSLGTTASICLFLMCFLPALGRIFANYFGPAIKLTILVISLNFALFCDCLIVPNCYLHSRCLDLHRNLSYLLAHTVEVLELQAREELDCTMDLYDQHTIWILRKELKLPEHSLDKFVTRAIGMQLTYANLLRVHFWCGVLLISMLFARSSIESPISNILGESIHLF